MKTVIGMFGVGIVVGTLPSPLDFIVLAAFLVFGGFALYLSIAQALHSIHNPEM